MHGFKLWIVWKPTRTSVAWTNPRLLIRKCRGASGPLICQVNFDFPDLERFPHFPGTTAAGKNTTKKGTGSRHLQGKQV